MLLVILPVFRLIRIRGSDLRPWQRGKTQQEETTGEDTTGEQQQGKITGVTMERHNRRTAKGK